MPTPPVRGRPILVDPPIGPDFFDEWPLVPFIDSLSCLLFMILEIANKWIYKLKRHKKPEKMTLSRGGVVSQLGGIYSL